MTETTTIVRRLGILLLGVVVSGAVAAQDSTVRTQPESRMWIEGSSSINQFSCHADSLEGQGEMTRRGAASSAVLRVEVNGIHCPNKRLTRDLMETLRADTFPTILFVLEPHRGVEGQSVPASRTRADVERMPVQARGTLTIAGQSRPVVVEGKVQLMHDGRYRLYGSKRVLLTDFGIEPPTKVFGLIKVRNEINVRFDLIGASARSETSTDFP